MATADFNAKIVEGQREALALEPRLVSQYEKVIRRAGKRAAEAFIEASKVITAAEEHTNPSLDEILHAEAVAASSRTTTRATRRRMARMVGAWFEDGELRRRVLPMLNELIDATAGIQAERLVEGSRDAIQSVIVTAQEDGLTVPQTAKLILDEMRSIAPRQATMLARTDLVAISNGSSLASASVLPEEDRPQFKTWITAGDLKVRPEHVSANQQTVPMMQPFNVGGHSMMYPGDPAGGDALTINCRCSIVYGDSIEPSLTNSVSGLDVFAELTAAAHGILPTVPYEIRERDGKQCVVKTDTGAVVKCHDDRSSARRHLAALILNVEDTSTAAAVDLTDGSMIALYPTEEQRQALVIPGGQEPETIHTTLIFFSEPPENPDAVTHILDRIAGVFGPLSGVVGGAGTFAGGENGRPVIVLPDVVGLNELRALISLSMDEAGVAYSKDHGFLPHITLAYDEESSAEQIIGQELTFESISFQMGEERIDYPLRGKGVAMSAALEMDAVTAAEFTTAQRERLAEEGVAMPDGSFPIRNTTDLRNAIQALGRAKNPGAARRHIIRRARALDAVDLLPEDWAITASGEPEDVESETVLAAVAAPLHPPAEWFEDPQLDKPTPITVTGDGQAFGHVALWDQCHTGFQDRCVLAPRGLSYDFFNTGVLDTEEGFPVKVGKITAATGHAPLTASRQKAIEHYDNTGSIVAYVTAGEDEHGPWIAGALKSDATPEQIRDLKANPVSGDWRSVMRASGQKMLELVGVLSVPVPGFPIQRAALAATGGVEEVTALITGIDHIAEEPEAADFERKMRVLVARAEGPQALFDLAQSHVEQHST